MPHDTSPLADRIRDHDTRFRKLLQTYRPHSTDKWDDRPVWDNWNKKPERPFDNRPTWDNWDKREDEPMLIPDYQTSLG
ncbi:MAG: multiple cyclophane-containing RiPP AmcA, partial [Pseudonocardiaceae bacterium]